MQNKEIIADLLASELVMDLKKDYPTDLMYRYYNEEEGTFEMKHTPKGEILINRFKKIILNYLNE